MTVLLVAASVASVPPSAAITPFSYAHPYAARADGTVYNSIYGITPAPAPELAAPVVGIAMRQTAFVEYSGDNGRNEAFWLAAADGGVFAQKGAPFLGSAGGIALNAPVVGIASMPSTDGYWLVAADGGVFTFGGAEFHGSTGHLRLVKPIVGMAATPSGRGYWLVAADGGVFTFGDAAFYGSAARLRLAAPIVAIARTRTGEGYWLLGRDGGVFTFGDATFDHGAATGGSMPAIALSGNERCGGYAVLRADSSFAGNPRCALDAEDMREGAPFVAAAFRLGHSG